MYAVIGSCAMLTPIDKKLTKLTRHVFRPSDSGIPRLPDMWNYNLEFRHYGLVVQYPGLDSPVM